MDLEFNLVNRGWLVIHISHDGQDLNIPVSYLSDAIGELILALCVFLEKNSEVVIQLQNEPGEYRFRVKPFGNNCVFQIYHYDDTFSKAELEKGECIFSIEMESYKLINKLYREIVKLKEIGSTEYKNKWGYDFPAEAFNRLSNAKKIFRQSRTI